MPDIKKRVPKDAELLVCPSRGERLPPRGRTVLGVEREREERRSHVFLSLVS